MVDDLTVPESQHHVPLSLEPGVTSDIVGAFSVLAAIAFDNDPRLVAGEVSDLWADRRNLIPSSCPPRSIRHNVRSAGVGSLRIARALSRSWRRSTMLAMTASDDGCVVIEQIKNTFSRNRQAILRLALAPARRTGFRAPTRGRGQGFVAGA